MLLFSATYKEPVRAFAERIISDPIVIKLREEELTLSNIRQYFMVCQSLDEQYKALCNLYGSFTIGQVMIFCQVRPLPGRALHCPSPVGNSRSGSFLQCVHSGLLPRPPKQRSRPQGSVENCHELPQKEQGTPEGELLSSASPCVCRPGGWQTGCRGR